MLIFGDGSRTVCPQDALALLLDDVRAIGSLSGIFAHQALAGAFIDAAELAQGLADARFNEHGVDDVSNEAEAAMRLVSVLAAGLNRSWTSGFEDGAVDIGAAVAELRASALPPRVTCKRAEGYAFYALYPEAFCEVALTPRPRGNLTVIGIRSIGLGLAAVVAAASGAAAPITVRPVGHPFDRSLSLSAALAARLRDAVGAFAVVDEGPGLSGSSFGAVLDALEAEGVERRRIHLFPSHAGTPGHRANAASQARWQAVPRHVTAFEPLIPANPDPLRRLENWFTDLMGPSVAPLEDLSGGAWRHRHYASEADWPAANISQERRKYLLHSADGPWLLKFAGLGRYGQGKLRRASTLAAAGFMPPVAGLRHGFLAERWMENWRPLDPAGIDSDRFLRHLGDYLGFRARHFPADAEDGGSLADLSAMLRHNAGEALGSAADRQLARICDTAAGLERSVQRIATDNRLHPHEWLQHPDGRLLKTDAIDHCAAHDLVGCQDVAWDIAGAIAEFDLSDAETEALVRRVEAASGRGVDTRLLRFLTVAYLAFQFGAARMAGDSLGGVPAEAARLDRDAARYRACLILTLEGTT